MSAVDAKRLQIEYKEFQQQNVFTVKIPNRKDMTKWHLSFRGPLNTPFAGGYYHFLLELAGYPAQAPHISALNDNGSFKVNQRICIQGITAYHQGEWSPGTKLLSVAEGIRAWMCLDDPHWRTGLAMFQSLDHHLCKKYASQSRDYECRECQIKLGSLKMDEQ